MRAAAICLREAGRIDDALRYAHRATEVAAALADPVCMSEAHKTLSLCLITAGDGKAAIMAADLSVEVSKDRPLAQARARIQRAVIRQRLSTVGWLDDYALALPVVAAHGDDHWEGLARLNRGTGLTYLGQLTDARHDLQRAAEIQARGGRDQQAGFARHNLGFASARAGDIPAALAAFAEAEELLVPLGVDMAPARLDLAETLLAAGMPLEAMRHLQTHLPTITSDQPALEPEARLLLARAQQAAVLPEGRTDATLAAELFDGQGREGWAALATCIQAHHDLSRSGAHARRAVRVADRVAAAGWADEAAELRAAAARTLAHDDARVAATVLSTVTHRPASLGARLSIASAWTAIAVASDDLPTALEHAERAMADLDEHRALLGASELRANVSRHAEQVLSQAAAAALQLGDLDQALAWADRVRSQALDHPPVVPPDDVELADALGRLRVVADDITRGRADGEDVSGLEDERTELERRVRDRSRTARGHGITQVEAGTRAPGTVEVAWMNLGTHLIALVADDSGTRRVDLEAGTDTIDAELDALGFAMQRVGRSRAPGRRRNLAARSLDRSLTALDEALVAPLGLPDDGAVVVSPTSVLFDVPWSGLPSLVSRAVAVGPSLRLARRPARQDAGSGTLLLEGPRLAHARAELDALAGVVADPYPVLGEQATVAAACEALPEATIAHLACHGVFRADNPQFSSLELADGPMFVYDLEALPRVPELLVLSACQTGRSAVHAGDELLGVTASLLAMGARHVVAALADVPDDLSAVLMLAFHEAVATGASPAAALARARGALLATHDEPAARLTAAAFACIGAP